MAISCNDFLCSARSFLSSKLEIDSRNAASRGYYAAYHICLGLKAYIFFTAVKEGHMQISSSLQKSGKQKIKAIGYLLQQCKAVRLEADYELASDFKKSDAEWL